MSLWCDLILDGSLLRFDFGWVLAVVVVVIGGCGYGGGGCGYYVGYIIYRVEC